MHASTVAPLPLIVDLATRPAGRGGAGWAFDVAWPVHCARVPREARMGLREAHAHWRAHGTLPGLDTQA